MKKLLLGAPLLFLFLALNVSAAGNASFALSTTKSSVKAGDTFQVNVFINPNGEAIDVARLIASFSASNIEAVSFQLGKLLSSASPGNSIDNVSGMISQGGYTVEEPVTDSGLFGIITFRAFAPGAAVIAVEPESKLINSGEERMNPESLAKLTITVTGKALATTQKPKESPKAPPPPVPTLTTIEKITPVPTAEQQAVSRFIQLAGRKPDFKNAGDEKAVHCMAYDNCVPPERNLVYEKEAIVFFKKKLGKAVQLIWSDVHAIAYTNAFIKHVTQEIPPPTIASPTEDQKSEINKTSEPPAVQPVPPVKTEPNAEQQALGRFTKLAGRLPDFSNAGDEKAVHCMAYDGCVPADRNLVYEKEAIVFIQKKLGGKAPMNWNDVHAVAYTDAFIKHVAHETAPPALQPPAEEPKLEVNKTSELPVPQPVPTVKTEPNAEQQALGRFTKLAGRLPDFSNAGDEKAVHCMAYDDCVPADRNLGYEKDAIVFIQKKLGVKAPMNWNDVHAVAYTDVFINHVAQETAPPAIQPPAEDPTPQTTTIESNSTNSTPSTSQEKSESENKKLEQEALGYFGKWYGHLPETEEEWSIHNCIAYDTCVPEQRDLVAENESKSKFQQIFKRNPVSYMDWSSVHAYAYLLLVE